MKRHTRYILSSLDGEKIFTESFSNSENVQHTFVISHGMGGDSNATIPFIQELSKKISNIQCITYDIRGHGYSTRKFPRSNSIISIFAHDLSSICQCYNLTDPIFIGHSLGGVISQQHLIENLQPIPQSVLLLSSLTGFPIPTVLGNLLPRLIFHVSQHQHMRPKRSVEDHLYYLHSFDFDLKRVLSDMSSVGWKLYILLYLSLFGWKNSTPQNIDKKQNLYLTGTKDWVIPCSRQRRFCKNFTQIEYKEVKDNHITILNSASVVADIIAKKLTPNP